jgi:DNA-binding transcriptional ArsR family regulator
MTFPKNALFSPEDQAISRISFALSHPARVFIARTLWDEGPKFVLDLEKMMPLTQGSISFHLHKMRIEGLVNVEELRLHNRYSLDMERMLATSKAYDEWYANFRIAKKEL